MNTIKARERRLDQLDSEERLLTPAIEKAFEDGLAPARKSRRAGYRFWSPGTEVTEKRGEVLRMDTNDQPLLLHDGRARYRGFRTLPVDDGSKRLKLIVLLWGLAVISSAIGLRLLVHSL